MTFSADRQDRNVSLRRAEASDARLLAQLGARLFEHAFGSSTTRQDMAAYLASAFSIEIQSAELADPDRVTWIAEDEGKAAAGYLMLRRGTRSNGVTSARPAELQRIYVDPTVQGQRVGESLVNACVEQAIAWHCDELWLGVWDQNERAIAFYRRMGFREVGTQTFCIGTDEQSDLVMSRTLMP